MKKHDAIRLLNSLPTGFAFPALALSALVLPALAHGQLAVTEINSSGDPGDFWELTNFGASAIDISGYTWDDDSANPGDLSAYTLPAGSFIAAGESIIFSASGTPDEFRTTWSLPLSVQVFTGGPGLGKNDRVYLFNASNTQVTTLGYAAGAFTRSDGTLAIGGHAGPSAGATSSNQSLIIDPNFAHTTPRYIYATGGNFDSFSANAPATALGSPGTIGVAGTNSVPVFQVPTTEFWTSGVALADSNFRVAATDADAGQVVTLSVLSKPAWLTLTNIDSATYRLNGTPPAPGDYQFTVRATDNATVTGVTDQTYTLSIFPASSPIFLNEYNAVSDTKFLNGGTLSTDEDLNSPGPTDSFFGRIPGNGGQWIEFVVVGNGTANSTTDMRGWAINIDSLDGTSNIVLSQHPYWSDVRAGTILTFIKNNTANGGLDTRIHHTSALHSGGFVWTNINTADPVFISQSQSTLGGKLGIGTDETRVIIRNASGTRIYGPSGEGVAADALQVPYGIGNTEIFRVETTPSTSVNPLSSPHNDASSFSTFGSRNRWTDGTITQSFANFISANSPPTFTSVPPSTRITSSFTYNITTTDPNGHPVAITAPTLPSFLTLAPGSGGTATLSLNRALTLADAGEYVVELIADDGQSLANTTPQAFVISVFHTVPSLILNEYNAVSGSDYFNGGDASADSDLGAASSDLYFGRIPGNGGNWFELVVTGDGGQSTVDLRGWNIEIGTSRGGVFYKSETIVLSDNPYWAAVSAGTILTFIEQNTANGGLDTGINLRNNLTTAGEAWTNIWLGDPDLLVYTDFATNGYTITGDIVEGIGINQDDIQFILKNPLGQRVFGPVGEGIAPSSGVTSTKIFKLRDHPAPSVSPLTESINFGLGYIAAASRSTFGLPNQWLDALNFPIEQDFSPYIATLTDYQIWAASFGLEGGYALASGDPDMDTRSNLHEYAFGGDPTLPDAGYASEVSHGGSTFTFQFVLREDSSLNLKVQRSSTLSLWTDLSLDPGDIDRSAHPTLADFFLVTASITPNPVEGREFFRASVTE